jgi:hypothetical protein
MKRLFFVLFLLTGSLLLAQQSATPPASPNAGTSVTYLFSWPQGVPWTKYSITVQSNGKTHFGGTPQADPSDTDTDPFDQDFTMWDSTRQKIFELAQKLNYFQGNFDAHIKHIAQTGSKTLEYQSPQVHGASTFNYSQNPDVQTLNRIFSGIATTFDYERKLTFQYRYDKLGMDQRLKELEELQASHEVEELHVLGPMLRKIAADPNLMNITRQSAKHILQKISEPDSTAPAPGQQ